MENDENLNEYGPMVSADDESGSLSEDVTTLQRRVQDLQTDKAKLEEEFGLKRKKFIDLYKQKETEAAELKTQLETVQKKFDNVVTEIEDIKTATAVSEHQRMEEVAELSRKYKDETASFDQVMKEAIDQALVSANEKFREKYSDLQQVKEHLEKEVQQLRSKLSEEREGFLSSVAKTLQKKVTGPASAATSEEQTLEDSMKKAQEDSDMLKSVVIPLEEEISFLKSRLIATRGRLKNYEEIEDLPDLKEHQYNDELMEQVRELQKNLDAEKSARSDLEKHVEVMKEQYQLAQQELENFKQVVTPGSDEGQQVQEKPPDTHSLTDELGLSPEEQSKSFDAKPSSSEPCEQCVTYGNQVKELTRKDKDNLAQLRSLDRQLELERNSVKTQSSYIEQLEAAMKGQAEEMMLQVNSLVKKLEETEVHLREASLVQSQKEDQTTQTLDRLTAGREQLQKELTNIQNENDTLMGKYQQNSQALNEEIINLPDTIEDLQILLLKKHEDLLQVTVGKEHIEQALRSELAFAKTQLTAEQQERQNLEESLSAEISQLQSQLEASQKFSGEATKRSDQYRSHLSEQKAKVFSLETEMKNKDSEFQEALDEAKQQANELQKVCNKYEAMIRDLRLRNQTLQNDLENSEDVQRDFVKLSQSLQMQLEKIRSAENEVRWQNEEDVSVCPHCGKNLSPKSKEHCRHCGHIFCTDCLSKTVPSGPNRKPAHVCDVCHTILVNDAAPFFSSVAKV